MNNSEIFSSTSNVLLFFVSWRRTTVNAAAQSTPRTVRLWAPAVTCSVASRAHRGTGPVDTLTWGSSSSNAQEFSLPFKVLTRYRHPAGGKYCPQLVLFQTPVHSKWCEERAHGYVMKNSHLQKFCGSYISISQKLPADRQIRNLYEWGQAMKV